MNDVWICPYTRWVRNYLIGDFAGPPIVKGLGFYGLNPNGMSPYFLTCPFGFLLIVRAWNRSS